MMIKSINWEQKLRANRIKAIHINIPKLAYLFLKALSILRNYCFPISMEQMYKTYLLGTGCKN